MSKLRKTKEDQIQAAKQSFQMEVKLQRVRFDMTQGELADQVDMNRSVLSRCLADPDKLSVGRLRKIIQILSVDPEIILALLGYSQKQIKNLYEVITMSIRSKSNFLSVICPLNLFQSM